MKIKASSTARLLFQTDPYCNFTHEHTIEVSEFEVDDPAKLRARINQLQELVSQTTEEGYKIQHASFREMPAKYFEV